MKVTVTAIVCCTILVAVTTPIFAQSACELTFERIGEDWVPSPLDQNTGELSLLDRPQSDHHGALRIPAKTPKSFGVTYYPWRDWSGYTTLSFELYLPPEMPATADVQVYIKDRHYWWFQSFPLHREGAERAPVRPGEWMSFELDISEDSVAWATGGHEKAWHRILHNPREFGIRIFCDDAWEGIALLDNVRLSGSEPPLGRFEPAGNPNLKYGLEVDLSAEQVPVYEKLEVTFSLDRAYSNPFDPEVVDVQGRFRSPAGDEIAVPGFYYESYTRSQTEEGFEKLTPVGEPVWKLRFAPMVEGDWTFYVSVRDALGELRSSGYSFTASEPLDPRGMVRISENDPMYFEFDNGELFTINGINMRDGGDQAEAQRGTYAFDYFFPRFAEEGLNFVRTWMAAWWGGIEWDDDYHSRYDGVGRYSMYNAWRLDYMFDLAAEHDLFIELTFNSHGQLRRDKYDAEWRYNPYAARNGGYLPSPSMLFTSEQVKHDFKKRYRYIIARWGYSQHLLSYDLWNEIDLSEGRDAAQIAEWHAEMGDYIKSVDPWDHLVCTHVCLYGDWGNALWDREQIEYVQADAYWPDQRPERNWHTSLNGFFDSKAHYRNKPMIFIEYGPQTANLPEPYEVWQRDFRVVGWIGNMMPLAGPPVWWYHEEWDDLELYRLQNAILRFNEGIDPRGRGMRKIEARTDSPRRIFAQAQSGIGLTTLYAFHWGNISTQPSPADVPEADVVKGASVTLIGVPEGTYSVQWWDPFEGEVIGEDEVAVDGQQVELTLPDFAQDVAAKLIEVQQ